MPSEERRPQPGVRVTVHFDAEGVQLNDVAEVARVETGGLVLKRSGSLRGAEITSGTRATVLFSTGGRLLHWPMIVEEVLPSRFFLRSLREPGEGERREFVRAVVPMRARLRAADQPWLEVVQVQDLSAAGFRLPGELPWEEGVVVEVELWPEEPDARPIRATAQVVRRAADSGLEFIELGSSDENRVADLVFGVREARLHERLNPR